MSLFTLSSLYTHKPYKSVSDWKPVTPTGSLSLPIASQDKHNHYLQLVLWCQSTQGKESPLCISPLLPSEKPTVHSG